MKKCPNCQTEFPDAQFFCANCGTKLEAPKMPASKPPAAKKRSSFGMFAVILAAILVIFLVAQYMTVPHDSYEAISTSQQTNDLILPILEDEDFQIIEPKNSNVLTPEQQNLFMAAGDVLNDVVPSDMIVQNFFYLSTAEQCTAAFNINIKDYKDILFLQYVNGNWVNLDYIILAGGQIMVDSLVDAPTAISALS